MFYNLQTIKPLANQLHNQHLSLVLATGFFDLLHQEHRNFLQQAKLNGDKLIVAVESDDRARRLKGEGRPIQTQLVRAQQLQNLNYVDFMVLLPSQFDTKQDHLALLTAIKPEIYAVSSHTSHLTQKARLVAQLGGQLRIVHQHNPAISTTKLISQNKL